MVTTIKELVEAVNISSALAFKVVTIISNMLNNSETALAPISTTCVPLGSLLLLPDPVC